MGLSSYPIPGLFGGVSQVDPAMRHPTQCAEQTNGLALTDIGMLKRPGTEHVTVLHTQLESFKDATCHIVDRESSGRHVLLLTNGSMKLFDMFTGEEQTVSYPHGTSYLNCASPTAAFRCVTVADYTFIVNREVTASSGSAVSPPNSQNVGYVSVKTVAPNIQYRISVNGTPFSYNTGATATYSSVASGLAAAIVAGSSGALMAYTLGGGNVVRIQTVNGDPIVIAVSDDWGNQGLVCVSNGVALYSDLPSAFESGYTVTVRGTANVFDDAYYVRWVGGSWAEAPKPGTTTTLDAATMPHRLIPLGDGTWEFSRIMSWGARAVGDDSTNPPPSFIGREISDIFFFRNRLGVLAGDSVVLSRNGDYFNFWASTATDVQDTDPIDLTSPSEQLSRLEWAVGFNQDLLLWGGGTQQLALVGGDILSPSSARIAPTTRFSHDPAVRPEPLGDKVLFASRRGEHTQISLYRVADSSLTNKADDVTAHCPRYIAPSLMQVSANSVSRAVVCIPQAESKSFEVLKYESDANDQWTQRAWQRFTLGHEGTVRILRAHWIVGDLYLVLYVKGSQEAIGRCYVERLRFNPTLTSLGFEVPVRLDRLVATTLKSYDGATTVVAVPYGVNPGASSPVVLHHRDGLEPLVLTPSAVLTNANGTDVHLPGDLRGAVLAFGMQYNLTYTFSAPVLFDRESRPLQASHYKAVRILLRYTDTGYAEALVTPLRRSTWTYPINGRAVGAAGQGATSTATATGTISIPLQCSGEGLRVSIESTSHLPCAFPYAEWVADVRLKAQR